MGFYSQQIFPRVMNRVCDAGQAHKIRARVCRPLAGEVVELGFGTGLNAQHLPAAVTRLRAVEPLPVAVRLARARIDASPVPIEIAGLDGQQLPFDDDSADAVLSTWTLCSIPDAVAAVREVRRVLRPGGTFHFAEHGLSPDPKVRRWQNRLNPIQNRIGAGCNFNRDIAAIVTAGGLRITKLDTYYTPGEPKVAGWMYEGVATTP